MSLTSYSLCSLSAFCTLREGIFLPTTKDLFIIEIFLRHEWQQIDFWSISIVK